MKLQFTISELTRLIKDVLETGFEDITVTGEISNCKLHSSGHLYLSLKDEQCQLSAVMWRSRVGRLAFKPQDGMKVKARGKISVYEVRGVYQFDILDMQPLGEGELQMAFERLKKKLQAEGLFDMGRKKPIPEFPHRIGIVTSRTGAALRDMVSVISRRFPIAEVILRPAQVQGVGAAEDIAAAIYEFNQYKQIDVMIVGRGGGSMEDLWAFNEEVVARAIAASTIPIVSAIGHEVDFTIADFVADLRAPTPSAAAELVVPEKRTIIENMRNFCYTAKQIVQDQLASNRDQVQSAVRSYAFNRPVDQLRQHAQHTDELRRSLSTSAQHAIQFAGERYRSLAQRIASVNPDAILRRGYAIVQHNSGTGAVVNSAAGLHAGDAIRLRFHDGERAAHVDGDSPSSSHSS